MFSTAVLAPICIRHLQFFADRWQNNKYDSHHKGQISARFCMWSFATPYIEELKSQLALQIIVKRDGAKEAVHSLVGFSPLKNGS